MRLTKSEQRKIASSRIKELFAQAQSAFNKNPASTVTIPNTGHNSISSSPIYYQALATFLTGD